MKYSKIEDNILLTIRPKQEERDRVESVALELLAEVDRSEDATGMVVGSIARDTWVSGDRDLDVFMLFDPSVTREDLEKKGLSLAKEITARFGGVPVEKYAEHPYINTNIKGFDIDLVPCYNIRSTANILSAVDRTPFHTRYIKEKVTGLTDDILLAKRFAKSCGVYGSDHMTEGFAGYLCELLVYHYGGFGNFIKAAASEWKPGLVIDIEDHRTKDFDEPLTVVDPVDPGRNVAASLSASKMAEFSEYARGYLEMPSEIFFEVRKKNALTEEEFKEIIAERGTSIHAIVFKTPNAIPDIVVPQLRKSVLGIEEMLERNGFSVSRYSEYMGEDNCILLFELLNENLPGIIKREGPPLWNRVHAEKFFHKHLGNTYAGPYIENARYYVEIERKYKNSKEILNSPEVLQSGLGRHVRKSMNKGYNVFSGEDCYSEEFSVFLHDFFRKYSPFAEIYNDIINK
ncbi:CCA tRNA nucleotidyltransferase [Methanoplanus endosymbiosus]|uniref:CCA-adding enzyme n=1 Tax=Methanoplanus endosymbiosus TaxID=33865 RepID=A0A9E7PLN1_9EURY|nr:CCA tRNA nucleotidyltransferase [Methanoplanus endosymbiosus]UUX92403.1 CCA tRNA nucleotidyltransferase [Methanoplanus endosymbiosus]